ncbi:hypothetical protein AMP2_gp058 [Pseudomonas phage vB_Pae_AM.P2]|uniref:Uncharacterized protein n=1 Tax=Pseudomonas phage vB_Pae_AM.P2 TaxID=2731695 RepID=A0A7S5W9H8_9CAUD|nr:hypothetical protein AMP2_gp058 [Pseudomonas phage vB_Pae_AM.P2]
MKPEELQDRAVHYSFRKVLLDKLLKEKSYPPENSYRELYSIFCDLRSDGVSMEDFEAGDEYMERCI